MKKAAYLLLPFICMVLSCSKDEGGFAKDEFGRISQTAYLPAGMPDNVAVFHNEWNPAAEDQYYTGVQAPVPASMQQDGSYSFSYPALPSVQAYNYYFLSPYKTTLTRSIHKGNSAVKARVFSVQYPSSEGIDGNYDYRIGTNAENVKSDDRLSCSGFKGIVSSLLVKVSDPGNVLEDEPLNVATITFESITEGALAGMFLTGHSSHIEDCGIIFPTSALRDEGTSYHYVPPSRFIEINEAARKAIAETVLEHGMKYYEVTTWSTDGFWRETKEKVAYRKKEGCSVVEMECSALAAVSAFRGVTWGMILYTADSLADVEKYDMQNWGGNAYEYALTLCLDSVLKL